MTIPATPSPTARLALDKAGDALNNLGDALARVRGEVADTYGRAANACAEAGQSVDAAEERRKEAEHRATLADAVAAETKRLMERRTTTLRTRAETAEESAKQAEAKLAEATHQISILYAVDEGRAHGARRIMNERDQAQARAEKAEAALRALRGVTDTDRAEKAEKALAAMEADRNGHRKHSIKAAQRLAQLCRDMATAEQRVAELEADRDAVHEALSLAPGQLHDVAVSAILGRGHTIGELIQRAKAAEADAERFKADHLAACKTIADMHEAATGRTGMGPIRGVVEDVADVRARAERLAKSWRDAEDDAAATAKRLDAQRRSLAAIFALDAETPFEEIREYAARTLNRNGERLLASKTQQARNAATLQRVRDADTLADALAAVAEHDGLPPEAARASANIAAALITPEG